MLSKQAYSVVGQSSDVLVEKAIATYPVTAYQYGGLLSGELQQLSNSRNIPGRRYNMVFLY